MPIFSPEIESYLSSLSTHLCPELEELERETYLKVLLPNMISGKEQGRFLNQFVSALRPQNVLELGTFTGYSAIAMALAMTPGSKLTTIDINEEIGYLPRKYFEKLSLDAIIDYRIEHGIEYCEKLEDNTLDLVFIDADKKNYPRYFEILKSKMKTGGYILVDNVLWHGKVVEPNPSKETEAILTLNRMAFEDSDFSTSIVPLRDGILISQKIS